MIKVKILSVMTLLFCTNNIMASDYPESKIDREIREMGSLISLAKYTKFATNEQKKQKKFDASLNIYLYRSALDVLKFAPIISADNVTGVIITDWYDAHNNSNIQFKVMVYVPNEDLSSNVFEVVAFERKKIDNAWSVATKSAAVAKVLEDKIAKKAKDFYLKTSK